MSDPSFPPLFSGLQVDLDPFNEACRLAKDGCDAGLITYDQTPDTMRAAIVFAPEVALQDAVIMLPICGIGFQNALGALAPPEVAVHLNWQGDVRVNGGRCGGLQMAAGGDDPAEEPSWLVVGLTVPLWPLTEDQGLVPDQTALHAEGCAEVDPGALLEAWARHSLVWINRWADEGVGPVQKEWQGLVPEIGETVEVFGQSGTFLGVDERFGMVLRSDDATHLIPLTRVLKEIP